VLLFSAGKEHHFGLEGWRAAFITVAIISFVIGGCLPPAANLSVLI
jgi:hypothetical protein